jgi:hypothetical protein
MRGKEIKHGARGGWALVEVLVCSVIISATAACVVEFAGVTARMSRRAHENSAMSLDLWSLANAADRRAPGVLSQGKWVASITDSPAKSGVRRADIFAGVSADLTRHSLAWAAWDIGGRVR